MHTRADAHTHAGTRMGQVLTQLPGLRHNKAELLWVPKRWRSKEERDWSMEKTPGVLR